MPVSKNPLKRDFYAYPISAAGYPFYIGIGRSLRGPDRLRYVRSLLKRQNSAKLSGSSLHVRLVAKLIRRHVPVKYVCPERRLTRKSALAWEREKIGRLVKASYLPANWQHNLRRHTSVSQALQAIER